VVILKLAESGLEFNRNITAICLSRVAATAPDTPWRALSRQLADSCLQFHQIQNRDLEYCKSGHRKLTNCTFVHEVKTLVINKQT
jgi:hypothetical protein